MHATKDIVGMGLLFSGWKGLNILLKESTKKSEMYLFANQKYQEENVLMSVRRRTLTPSSTAGVLQKATLSSKCIKIVVILTG